MSKRIRLDVLVTERGLAASREQARRLVMAGAVVVNEQRVDKPGTLVDPAAEVRVKDEARSPYVSRGGHKLAAALRSFPVDVAGVVAIDVGASTGGFTDCLLQHGAARVYAVDVGYGQLAWSLRQDPRVVSLERRNIRTLTLADLGEAPELAVIDASFISLALVIPPVLELLAPQGRVVALIKPQFEVGKGRVGKGGVVRDPALHVEVVENLSRQAETWGVEVMGVMESPLLGPKGNKEFLLYLRKRTLSS
ncbi:MAG: TlyA family RNA methyltransferase [Deltaproteobacteria bacterium]|nr:TlyA family RNA methyltransferase [Deltaproteobacteria bacterium]